MTIITITGPSCSGKSTLEAMLVRQPTYKRVISHTTRPMRTGEVNGENYFFVTGEEFNALSRKGAFVEEVEFAGSNYAASKQQFTDIIAAGDHAVIVVEPDGREAIVQWAEENGHPVLPVFVGSSPYIIAERYVERMFSDFSLALATPGKAEKVVEQYKLRLGAALGEEQQWGPMKYPTELAFQRFAADNQDRVLAFIIKAAEHCQTVADMNL